MKPVSNQPLESPRRNRRVYFGRLSARVKLILATDTKLSRRVPARLILAARARCAYKQVFERTQLRKRKMLVLSEGKTEMTTTANWLIAPLASSLLCCACLTFPNSALGQAPPPLISTPTNPAAAVPSLENPANNSNANAPATQTTPAGSMQSRRSNTPPKLPTDAGQYYEEYDIKPYTKELTTIDRPQQAIVDWVLRETGTDAWFTEPFGFVSADRNTLRVYHNEQMHQLVRGVHEKFVNGTTAPQLYGVRLLAIGNPNWRTRAHALMRTVQAQSPGVNAYLVSKENSAMLMAMLRGRTDFKELSSVDIVVQNGQSQVLEQLRGRNYVSDFKPIENSWPPYMPVTGEIKEGYRLQISPLLSVDKQSVDLVVKCNIDQVERLANVTLEMPLTTGQVYPGQINVPQVASWRLHERFRWPADQVLLLSCGVVAAPQGAPNASLLGQGTSLIGLDRILPNAGDRADALLLVEYRGDATGRVGTAPPNSPSSGSTNTAQQNLNPLSRGRY